MNRRQRKKNRTGEFTVYGFDVEARYIEPITHSDTTLDELIAFLEENNLCGSGGCSRETICIFVLGVGPGPRFRPRSCTDDERVRVTRFLGNHPKIESATAGPLVDVWR